MSDKTAQLGLEYYVDGQGSGYATINEFLNRLDAAICLNVKDKDLNTPPGSPAAGDRYIVGPTPTGAWADNAGKVTVYYGGWKFLTPQEGWLCYVHDEDIIFKHSGSAWAAWAATTSLYGPVKMAAACADLDQDITNPPTEAEVQAISDKIDDLLAKLRTAGILAA